MNYTQLKEQIQNYVESSFTDAQLDTFIQNAEERIYNSVQLPALRKNVTGTISPLNKYLACPDDFLAVFSIAVIDENGDYNYLLNKDVNFIRESYPSSSYYGKPRYYALFGPRSDNFDELTFILGPTPDTTYTAELHYFFYPPSITTAGTSWLGDNFESVLLYGSILEAYTYLKGEADIMANYRQRYDEAMMLLIQLGDGKEKQDAYRSGSARVQVTR